MILRESNPSDIEFMKDMLYEAVFWRDPENRPSKEDALELPDVKIALENWGERKGDIAVISEDNDDAAGAAWIRYWSEDVNIRGYIDSSMPVLVIGVHENHRKKGIGSQLIQELLAVASTKGIKKISLCVSKDNHAFKLYEKEGFVIHSDIGDSYLMVREL